MGLLAQLRADIACVFPRDPAARNRFEVLTTYPGVHAILVYRVAHRLWSSGWLYAARLLSYLARIWTNIEIHPAAKIGKRFFIDHGAGVVIGETAEIGDDVTLYHGVTLGGTSWSKGKRHPTVHNGVVIGAGAKILGLVTIGAGAKVGANSVVIHDVPDHRTVVGIPAKVVTAGKIARRHPHVIDLNPDPLAGVINTLLARVCELESRAGIRNTEKCETCNARQEHKADLQVAEPLLPEVAQR